MPCPKKKDNLEKKTNLILENNVTENLPGGSTNCQMAEKEELNNGIEKSARFSIRVMEAMRSLQRRNNESSLTSANIKDIAEYIKANYNFDGDLDAQVRTVLSRIWRQGFIMKIGKEDYLLMGPFASFINKVDCYLTTKSSRKRKRKSRSRCPEENSAKKQKKKRKSKRGRKNGNSAMKVIKDPEPRNLDENLPGNNEAPKSQKKDSSKNRSRSSSRDRGQGPSKIRSKNRTKKLKNSKKKTRLSEKPGCGCGRIHDNNQVNEDFQTESSINTFVTCCEKSNPGNSRVQKKILKSDLNVREQFYRPSREINESSSNSDEENSNDSIYQELKSKNVKNLGCNGKDLKKWIKHCRQKYADQ